jgi:hypothetical protein
MKFDNLYKLNVKAGDIVYNSYFKRHESILEIRGAYIKTHAACYSLLGVYSMFSFHQPLGEAKFIITHKRSRIHEIL